MPRPKTTTPDQRKAYLAQWDKDHMKTITGAVLTETYALFPAGTFVRRNRETGCYYDPFNPTVQALIPANLLRKNVTKKMRRERYEELCTAAGFLV